MKTKLFFTAILCCYFILNGYSQKREYKFGKIDNAELTAAKCPIDSSADAYILCDNGCTYFEFMDYKGDFTIIYEHYVRIKILKKAAFDWASVSISLHKYSSGEEELVEKIKGNTYNFEDGKVVVSKLEKSATFKEEVNKNNFNLKFTLPNVKEGSVLEYSYKVQCHYLRDFTFQKNIPVLHSEYEVTIPEYYLYKNFQNGYEPIKITKNFKSNGISFPGYDRISYTDNQTTYTCENLKAFKDEPFMKSKVNYVASIELELQSIQFPHSLVKEFSTNWKSITKELLEDDDFGVILKRQGATDDIVKKATEGLTVPIEKATAIFATIRNQFKWNGSERYWASKTIRKTLEDKSGNSADINLLLVTALRNAGFKADPVVLSTRENGMILTAFPVKQKLNYVIACLNLDGKQYLLDATDKQCPFGLLPQRCLNGQGRIIREESPEDVELTSNQNYYQNINTNVKISENGDVSGAWNEVRKGYAAHNFRSSVADSKSKDDFIQEKQKQNAGLSIVKYQFDNLDTLNKEIRIAYDLAFTGQTETAGNLLMIHPLLTEQLKENIFKSDDRKFPVDFSFGSSKTFVAQFEIPQGYEVETLPKPVMLALPNKDAIFTYNVVKNENRIQVLRKVSINKIMFLPEEYQNLKEFYNQMVAKEAEVIVLKKI